MARIGQRTSTPSIAATATTLEACHIIASAALNAACAAAPFAAAAASAARAPASAAVRATAAAAATRSEVRMRDSVVAVMSWATCQVIQ